VIYAQKGGGAVWIFRRDGVELPITLEGRLRVSAAEGVRAAVFAGAGVAIASEWMFALELADGTVKAVLQNWELPSSRKSSIRRAVGQTARLASAR
jgi:DNA-binding transcriptional LysR family regulator